MCYEFIIYHPGYHDAVPIPYIKATQYQASKARHQCLLAFHHPEFSCGCFSVGGTSGSTWKKTFLVMQLRAQPQSFQTYSSCWVFQGHRCLLGCSSQIEILVTSLQIALQTTIPLDSSGPIKSWWYYPSNLVKVNGTCRNLHVYKDNYNNSPDRKNKVSRFALTFSNQERSILSFVQHHCLCLLSRHVSMKPSDNKIYQQS